MKLQTAAVFLLVLLVVAPTFAQEKSAPAPQEKSAPAANAADVASPDAIIAALYDVISGPAGQKRDWNRFRSLFALGARLIPTFRAQTGAMQTRVLDPEEYLTRSSPRLEESGFFEREVARKTDRFGNLLHAFSTYESRHKSDEAQPFVRGINSIQLSFDGTRWWIVTVFWQAESPDTPLPKQYLP